MVQEASPEKSVAPPRFPEVYDTADYWASKLKGGKPIINGCYISCGVTMLLGLTEATPKQVVDKVLKERADTDAKTIREAFVMFSDIDYSSRKGGNAIYKYIKEKGLGNIVEFGPRMNPNTGNMIKMWVWEPPHHSLRPENRRMPVHAKLWDAGEGRYVADPRFQENRAVPSPATPPSLNAGIRPGDAQFSLQQYADLVASPARIRGA